MFVDPLSCSASLQMIIAQINYPDKYVYNYVKYTYYITTMIQIIGAVVFDTSKDKCVER